MTEIHLHSRGPVPSRGQQEEAARPISDAAVREGSDPEARFWVIGNENALKAGRQSVLRLSLDGDGAHEGSGLAHYVRDVCRRSQCRQQDGRRSDG
jgi:hypothetical protein